MAVPVELTDPGTLATLQVVLDLVGVFVFALSGALLAVRRGLDLFGVLVLAWVAGLGGGTLRDVLLGRTPPAGVSDGRLVTAALLATALMAPLEEPIVDQQVRIEGLEVERIYAGWTDLVRRVTRP